MQSNIYVLMTSEGSISADTHQIILAMLDNELARKNITRALIVGREELNKANIYIMGYANCDLYFVRAWDGQAARAILKVKFVNQKVHDMDYNEKMFSIFNL